MSRKIRVVVRVRPALPIEKTHSTNTLILDTIKKSVKISSGKQQDPPKEFQFDSTFDSTTTQTDIYEQTGIASMVANVLEGFHATIFAYGQTGSGKTFTMEGYEYEKTASRSNERVQAKPKVDVSMERIGIVPRVILNLFKAVAAATTDKILDLLNPSMSSITKPCRLRWASNEAFYVENLTILECSASEEMLARFQDGVKQKIMASHNMNAASSRSHCIYTIYVESTDIVNPEDIIKAKLSLVDLAGSERVVKTGATGVTLQESIGINKSLFVLRQVIQILSDQSKERSDSKLHVPYRDSKLTALLKHSLGGNSITLMIACLSPSDAYFDENVSTLTYAARAQTIANKPIKNEDPKSLLIQNLRDEIASLKAQLTRAYSIIDAFESKDSTLNRNNISSEIDTRIESNSPATTIVVTEKNNLASKTIEAKSKNNQEVEPTPPLRHSSIADPAGSKSLKLNVIDNVSMIKAMYQNERRIRQELEMTQSSLTSLRTENHGLNIENQTLRERMEVLEYLALGADESGISLQKPSQDRINSVLQNAGKRRTINSNTNQETLPPVVEPKKSHETGVLSISELRHLLNGKKQQKEATIKGVPSRRAHSAAELPRSEHKIQTPTPSQSTPSTALEKDPVENLSELNRLLRAKAALKGSISQ
ncbi:Kinesin motor domain containing protein [Thraustotheca clavata]|uniref:Kinesin-like protein n=1 Tax=Thraustotheca clavata TaxID=74557 RepID=A0A1V9ZWK6_9STRA|nr:Kinesin motor domain containing protein [Thraustotheca clavata]